MKAQPFVEGEGGGLAVVAADLQGHERSLFRLGHHGGDQPTGQSLPPESLGHDQASDLAVLAPHRELYVAHDLTLHLGDQAYDLSSFCLMQAPGQIIAHIIERIRWIAMAM